MACRSSLIFPYTITLKTACLPRFQHSSTTLRYGDSLGIIVGLMLGWPVRMLYFYHSTVLFNEWIIARALLCDRSGVQNVMTMPGVQGGYDDRYHGVQTSNKFFTLPCQLYNGGYDDRYHGVQTSPMTPDLGYFSLSWGRPGRCAQK